MIRGKVAEYMERAEKLKQHLNQNDDSNRKKPSAMGANGKAAGGGGKAGKCVLDRVAPLPSTDRVQGRRRRGRRRVEEAPRCAFGRHPDGEAKHPVGGCSRS
jgi:hypothetical protein